MSAAESETACVTGFARDLELVADIDAVPAILSIVCRITGMGFAAVARVTEDAWVACAVRDEMGFNLQPGDELPIKTTLCDEVRGTRSAIVISDVSSDPIYAGHHTPALYGLQSYISFPITRSNGEIFGTLCAIDRKPADLTRPDILEAFRLFSQLLAFHMDAVDRVAASEAALLDAHEAAILREQFVAVLGHDLRNPLAAVQAGASMLQRADLAEQDAFIVQQIHESAMRMERLIADILDFARGRLGGGIPLTWRLHHDLDEVIERTVQELRAAHPGRAVVTDIAIGRPVSCDADRLAQLLSNLLANALTHGSPTEPVLVEARTLGAVFELAVSNAGAPIPEAALSQLFQPFKRKAGANPKSGLGLGLYIASQIAEGHGGGLDVSSTPDKTRFRMVMPLD